MSGALIALFFIAIKGKLNASPLPYGRCILRWRGNAYVNADHTPRRAQHSWQAGQVGTHLPIFAKSRIVEISQKCLLGSSLIPLIQFKNWSNALWARLQKKLVICFAHNHLFCEILHIVHYPYQGYSQYFSLLPQAPCKPFCSCCTPCIPRLFLLSAWHIVLSNL